MKDVEYAESKEKPNFRFFRLLFFELCRKNSETGNSLNAIERVPVPTKVLNPKACGIQGVQPRWGCGGAKPSARKKIENLSTFFKISIFFSQKI